MENSGFSTPFFLQDTKPAKTIIKGKRDIFLNIARCRKNKRSEFLRYV
jgi:hypothetical protein